MRMIKQVHPIGCGIACVAMLLGKSYTFARRELFPDGVVDYTDIGELKSALNKNGMMPASRMVSYRRRPLHLSDDAILKVNVRSDGSWHWVVWDSKRKKILDPKVPPYTESRLRFHSYLVVKMNTKRRRG